MLFIKTLWSLLRYRYHPVNPGQPEHDLPSVSVCIAARDETHALAQCLERVVRSDYKKLEVLVLDDSSQDDTSLIIKSFAQAGVRFIAGGTLPSGWLGKNHTYQTLIEESSGDYILFLDVDTVIIQTTITQLINQVIANKRAMISVLPRREDTYHASALFGTMRYYWELVLSNPSKPPASSAIWMVHRETLNEAGVGLPNYGLSVRPERHLARQLQKRRQYFYVVGSRQLGVAYEKRLKSQYETALRLYYPMSGRRLLWWCAAAVFVVLLIYPLTLFFIIGSPDLFIWIWAGFVCAITAATFGLFTVATYGSIAWVLRVIIGPWLLLQEAILLTASHILYRTNKVTWKGRPVAAQPVRHDALTLDE